MAFCDWLVPLRQCDLTGALGSESSGTERWRRLSPARTSENGGAEAAAVAGDAQRRCRESWVMGRARTGAARDGELNGGVGVCGGGSCRRRGSNGDGPSGSELRRRCSRRNPARYEGAKGSEGGSATRGSQRARNGRREPADAAGIRRMAAARVSGSSERERRPGGARDEIERGEMERRLAEDNRWRVLETCLF